MKRISARQR
ncbi:hypothetical protein D043_4895A, partial [Vibrio parahaemolyticus EKP-021]